MKNIFRHIAFVATLLISTTSFVACDKGQQNDCDSILLSAEDCLSVISNFVADSSSSIIGTWKPIKSLCPSGRCFDISCDNIMYEFRANGVLTISGRNGKGAVESFYFSMIEHSKGKYQIYSDDFLMVCAVSHDKMIKRISHPRAHTWTSVFIRINPIIINK